MLILRLSVNQTVAVAGTADALPADDNRLLPWTPEIQSLANQALDCMVAIAAIMFKEWLREKLGLKQNDQSDQSE